MKIGVFGGGAQQWPSLNRTYRSYVDALSQRHDVVEVEAGDGSCKEADVLINFGGNGGWDILTAEERPPVVFALHGGAVLNAGFVQERLARLRPGDCFIGNCASDKHIIDALNARSPPPTHVVPLPVAGALPGEADRANARAELGIGAGEGVIVIVSRLVPQKNVHNALRAVKAALLDDSRIRWRVVLVGSFWPDYRVLRSPGLAYHDWLRAEVLRLGLDDRLTLFPSNLSDVQLQLIYCAADVALSLSHSVDENFGYFALEAMAMGVPVIGTSYGGQKDSIIAGETGWPLPTWYTPAGIRSSHGQVARLLAGLGGEELSALRLSAHQYVATRYGFQDFADMLNGICERAYNERRENIDTKPVYAARAYPAPTGGAAPVYEHDSLADYALGISYYVSRLPPSVAEDDLLVPYAPLARAGAAFRTSDPAWPLTFRADPDQRPILEEVLQAGRVRAVRGIIGPLQRLVDSGILVPDVVAC